jgi:hypothetical protein
MKNFLQLEKLKERFYNELHILFELFVILYADGTVLLSETKEGNRMQQSLNIFQLPKVYEGTK